MSSRRFLTTDDLTDINGKIPTRLSQMNNDTGFVDNKYMAEKIEEAMANSNHLTCRVVTDLPSDTSAVDNVIYLKKGNVDYESYMKINGKVVKIGGGGVGATVKEVTVQPSQWVNRIFTYSDPLITKTPVENTLIWNAPEQLKDGNDQSIENMRRAIFSASIVGVGQENGKAYLKCEGTVPSIAIKMKVVII